jgi:hypothetical protein
MNDTMLHDGGAVYATGSLNSTERVGSINGLPQKLITPGLSEADFIYVPLEQIEEATAVLYQRGDLEVADRVFGVASVSEALAHLCEKTPGAPSCVRPALTN